jgi:hypothetical protein
MLANLKRSSWKWFWSWKLSLYYFKLQWWILQKFRNWFDLVWIIYAKVIKELRKTEKKRSKGEIKIEKGPGEPNRPSTASSPQPNNYFRTGTLCFPSPSLTYGPYLPGHVNLLQPPAVTSSTGNRRPALLPHHHRTLMDHQGPTYKMPSVPSLFPLFPPIPETPPGSWNSSPESAVAVTVYRRFRRTQTTPEPLAPTPTLPTS